MTSKYKEAKLEELCTKRDKVVQLYHGHGHGIFIVATHPVWAEITGKTHYGMGMDTEGQKGYVNKTVTTREHVVTDITEHAHTDTGRTSVRHKHGL
jgi:hypothetical protein